MNPSNLPPGVTTSMIPGCGPDQPCDVCGGFPDSKTDPCICPECPTCEDVGESRCYVPEGYSDHGLILTDEQKFLRAWQDALEEDMVRSEPPEEDFDDSDPNEGLPSWA